MTAISELRSIIASDTATPSEVRAAAGQLQKAFMENTNADIARVISQPAKLSPTAGIVGEVESLVRENDALTVENEVLKTRIAELESDSNLLDDIRGMIERGVATQAAISPAKVRQPRASRVAPHKPREAAQKRAYVPAGADLDFVAKLLTRLPAGTGDITKAAQSKGWTKSRAVIQAALTELGRQGRAKIDQRSPKRFTYARA